VEPPKQYRYDVEYEAQRRSCCDNRQPCCQRYRDDDDDDDDDDNDGGRYIVIARNFAVGGRPSFDSHEWAILQRIHERQRLLHKLLQTHQSEYYDQHFARERAERFARWQRARDSVLSPSEYGELQDWLARLPVVPHLSVLELDAKTKQTREADSTDDSDASFIELQAQPHRRLKPAHVLKGFVDIEREPFTLSQLLNQLPPMPAIVAD